MPYFCNVSIKPTFVICLTNTCLTDRPELQIPAAPSKFPWSWQLLRLYSYSAWQFYNCVWLFCIWLDFPSKSNYMLDLSSMCLVLHDVVSSLSAKKRAIFRTVEFVDIYWLGNSHLGVSEYRLLNTNTNKTFILFL